MHPEYSQQGSAGATAKPIESELILSTLSKRVEELRHLNGRMASLSDRVVGPRPRDTGSVESKPLPPPTFASKLRDMNGALEFELGQFKASLDALESFV